MYAPVGASGPSLHHHHLHHLNATSPKAALLNSWWMHAPAGGAVGHGCDREGNSTVEGGSDRGGVEGHGVGPRGGIMDSHQQQFCLKWNSFGSNLATAFSNLFKSESLTDVTLFCEGVTFKAHRLILAACSKHFQELFEGMPPSPAGLIVILDGTSAHNMAALLEFMYRGEVHVGQESLSSFLKAAECLQVKGLSIEHEKLAVAQRHAAAEGNNNNNNSNNKDNNSSSNSNGNSSKNGGGPTGSSSPSSADQQQPQQQSPTQQQQQPSSSSNNNAAAAHSSSGISSTSSNNGNGNCSNATGNGSQQSASSTSSASSGAPSHNGSAESCATAAELLLQTSGGAGLGHQEPLLAAVPINGPVALDRGIKRRRTPTPAPPSPHAPTYSLPNVYSSATHYYDSPQKRLMRSPSDVDSLARASVLREGGAAFRPASAPHPLLLENHLYQFGGHPSAPDTPTHSHTAPHTPTELEREVIKREHSEEREHNGETKEGVAEDLRIKQEPSMSDRERMEKLAERLSSESYSRSSFDSGNYVNSSEHIERQQREQRERELQREQQHRDHREQLHREQQHQQQQQQQQQHREREQQQMNPNNVGPMGLGMSVMPPVHPPTPDLSPAPATPSTWNSKLNKAGTVTTPDGKKLKCPFCERLYGYETNLRAHIRQRHQGIRVPCPFCSRTFTRNNTVRRHIAREHKPELGLKALQQANHSVPDPVPQ